MNLLQARTKFVQLSGRYDLVVDTSAWADNGADFFINAGQKYLDKIVDVPVSTGSFYKELAIGEYAVSWEHNTRAILEVWVENTEGRARATKYDLSDVKENYYKTVSNTDDLIYNWGYAIADLRGVDVTDKDALGEYIESVEPAGITVNQARGIIIVPIPTTAVVVQIKGLFHQLTLTADADENWWSLNYPHILVMGALRMIEVFNRNSTGVEDWSSAIMSELVGIDKDGVLEGTIGKDVMEG